MRAPASWLSIFGLSSYNMLQISTSPLKTDSFASIVQLGKTLKEARPKCFLNTLFVSLSFSAVAFLAQNDGIAEGFSLLTSWAACESHASPFDRSSAKIPWHFPLRNVTWSFIVLLPYRNVWNVDTRNGFFLGEKGRMYFVCHALT